MKFKILISIILPSFLFSACMAPVHSYTPIVNLETSSVTINKSIFVEEFIDKSPPKDRKDPFVGYSVTNRSVLDTTLSFNVTTEIKKDFLKNKVFSQISNDSSNYDFLLKGEIIKFAGKGRATTYATISIFTIYGIATWVLGMPIQKVESEIILKMELIDSKGNLVSEYIVNSSTLNRYSFFKLKELNISNQINHDFSDVISQVRNKIINDLSENEKSTYN